MIDNEEMTKVYKWVKQVMRRVVTSTRSVPPQGEIISSASRTRATDDHGGAAERPGDQLLGSGGDVLTGRWPSAEAIFEAYLEGDLEAGKITEGWALRHRETVSASGGVHGDPPATHDPYAWQGPVWAMLGRRRGLRCALGLHDDGTDCAGGHSPTCLRCGGPV